MAKPTDVFTWATGALAQVLAPSVGKQALGFMPGSPLPAPLLNSLLNTIGQWIAWAAALEPSRSILGFGALSANAPPGTSYLVPGFVAGESALVPVGVIVPFAGVIWRFDIKCGSAPGDTSTAKVTVNGAASALLVTFNGATTTLSVVGALSVAAGDVVGIQINLANATQPDMMIASIALSAA